MLLHVEQIGDLRAAPAVDALVVVAHDAEVAVVGGQLADELELGGVGVLVFVHHHISILRAAGGQGVGMPGKKPQRQQDQVVEIHRVAGAQRGLVARADVLGQRGGVGVAEDRRRARRRSCSG